jgi:hypothetical protein
MLSLFSLLPHTYIGSYIVNTTNTVDSITATTIVITTATATVTTAAAAVVAVLGSYPGDIEAGLYIHWQYNFQLDNIKRIRVPHHSKSRKYLNIGD